MVNMEVPEDSSYTEQQCKDLAQKLRSNYMNTETGQMLLPLPLLRIITAMLHAEIIINQSMQKFDADAPGRAHLISHIVELAYSEFAKDAGYFDCMMEGIINKLKSLPKPSGQAAVLH